MASTKYALGDSVWCGGRKGKVLSKVPGDKTTLIVSYSGEVHRERVKDLSATKGKKKK